MSLPVDPAARRRVEEAQRKLAQARVVDDLGDRDRAITLLQEARDAVGDLYPPLAAELACSFSKKHSIDGELDAAFAELDKCAALAAEAKDDARLVEAWTDRFGIEGYQQGDYELALSRTDMIETLLLRAGDPPEQRAEFLRTRALVLERADRREEAERDAEAAVELHRSHGDLAGLASALNNLGALKYDGGRWQEARRDYEEALELGRGLFGPTHARTYVSELNLISIDTRDRKEYIASLSGLLDRMERDLGPDHEAIAFASMNIGQGHLALGQPEQAVPFFERGLAVRVKLHGEQHAHVATARRMLSKAHQALGQDDAAVEQAGKALEIQRAVLPKDHPELAWSLEWLGILHQTIGDERAALPLYEETQRILERPPVIDPRLGRAQYLVGTARRALGMQTEACAAFAAALETLQRSESEPAELPDALVHHAACIAAEDWQRARDEAERGLELFAKRPVPAPPRRARLELVVAEAFWPRPELRPRARELEASLTGRLKDPAIAAEIGEKFATWQAQRAR